MDDWQAYCYQFFYERLNEAFGEVMFFKVYVFRPNFTVMKRQKGSLQLFDRI